MDAEITDPAVLRFLYGWPTGEDFLDAVEGTDDGIQLTPRKPVWLASSSAVTIPLVNPPAPRPRNKIKIQRRGPPGPTIKEISAEEAADFEAKKKNTVRFAQDLPASTHRSKKRRVDAGGILRPVSESRSAPALTHQSQNSGPNIFTMSDLE
jgi:hypothetical protein